jgi:cytochrome c peroxidase
MMYWLNLICAISMIGCGQSTVEPKPSPPIETTHDGNVVLGSPSLTAGIPGSGPLSLAEIRTWLENANNHQVLQFVLPDSLAADAANIIVPADNLLTRAKIELGRQLFFDKRLSGIGTFSCATCHRPEQSFTSYLIMPEVGRNASTLFNRILGREHFWDGRASSLEAQPLSPVENPFEMNSSPQTSTANIAQIAGYRLQFERIFGAVTFANICKAIACFERAIVTNESAWDKGQLSESAQRGENLFFSDRLGCDVCHTGRNFTDEQFYNLGVDGDNDAQDVGRYEVTKLDSDRGSFKTPSLRNVAKTPPYMHNGRFGTLEEVIDFFDSGGESDSSHNENPLDPLGLTAKEKQDLLEFLQSLTSELSPVEVGRLPE